MWQGRQYLFTHIWYKQLKTFKVETTSKKPALVKSHCTVITFILVWLVWGFFFYFLKYKFIFSIKCLHLTKFYPFSIFWILPFCFCRASWQCRFAQPLASASWEPINNQILKSAKIKLGKKNCFSYKVWDVTCNSV